MSPKSITALIEPSATTMFAECRSPCSHSAGPSHSATSASSAEPVAHRSELGSAGRVRATGSGDARARRGWLRSAGRTRRSACRGGTRCTGASAGAGRCKAATNSPSRLASTRRIGQRDVGRHVALEPRADAPRPRIAGAGPAGVHRRRDRDRQPARQLGEPAMLVLDEVGAELAPRHPHEQVVAEPEDRVVPTVGDEASAAASARCGELLVEERADEVDGDVDLGGGHVLRRHGISLREGDGDLGLVVGVERRRGSTAGRRSRRPRSACRSAAASRAAGCASGCAGCTRRA